MLDEKSMETVLHLQNLVRSETSAVETPTPNSIPFVSSQDVNGSACGKKLHLDVTFYVLMCIFRHTKDSSHATFPPKLRILNVLPFPSNCVSVADLRTWAARAPPPPRAPRPSRPLLAASRSGLAVTSPSSPEYQGSHTSVPELHQSKSER